MNHNHTFHIPVMGIGFSVDSPLKVALYGIDSVMSLVDDVLLEKLRKMYSGQYNLPFSEITEKMDDFRAKRITAYLNLIKELVEEKFEQLKNNTLLKMEEITSYVDVLPYNRDAKNELIKLYQDSNPTQVLGEWFDKFLPLGSIDVNIMTKVDKANYKDNEKLPTEYNDAHAALRGYAKSKLNSSLVLSAGMNPRLYGYLENFEDFFPNKKGEIRKKIVLKVSDYRSALIQGKYLAKKGLWVSEFRIESGLNCGGHAFATDGFLLGPVLADFRDKRTELLESIHDVFINALTGKNHVVPDKVLSMKITAQGGVGTSEEHVFLLEQYELDSVGWGTPFLLVPEVTNVDDTTMDLLLDAKEDDLYLSNISPLGVPFNSLKNNTKDIEKLSMIEKGRPGSACPRKFVQLNHEFNDTGLCTASRQYQQLKLKETDRLNLTPEAHQAAYNKIVEKSCICVGLGTSALLVNNIGSRVEGKAVSVCPGPNMAYFNRKMKLKEMIDHIYGKINVITRSDRPNFLVKELSLYLDYLKNKIEDVSVPLSKKERKYFNTFSSNLENGIQYYLSLLEGNNSLFSNDRIQITRALREGRNILQKLVISIPN